MQEHEFGQFGGRYVPPQLFSYLDDLEKKYKKISKDDNFQKELFRLLRDYVGRPSPLYYAKNLSEELGYKLYLKREDLNHTGAHKINNTVAQVFLAREMNKKEIIAETGAGQHGVATATSAALFGLECTIFMGEIDAEKQKTNLQKMELLGANVNVIRTGGRVLKDAVDATLEYLIGNSDAYFLLGSVVGPHPYPTIVRDFQKIIGEESKKQILRQEGKMPRALIACIGAGSNMMGLFYDFIKNEDIELIAVEAGGKDNSGGNNAATLTYGKPGIIHGFKGLVLQKENGEIEDVHSIASGMDHPCVGPEPSYLKESGRLKFSTATDEEVISAYHTLVRKEGIFPAFESCHAIAYALRQKGKYNKDDIIIVNLSGRGDKDIETINNYRNE